MSSIQELEEEARRIEQEGLARAEALRKQAEALRQEQREKVRRQVQALIDQHAFTAGEISLATPKGRRGPKKKSGENETTAAAAKAAEVAAQPTSKQAAAPVDDLSTVMV